MHARLLSTQVYIRAGQDIYQVATTAVFSSNRSSVVRVMQFLNETRLMIRYVMFAKRNRSINDGVAHAASCIALRAAGWRFEEHRAHLGTGAREKASLII